MVSAIQSVNASASGFRLATAERQLVNGLLADDGKFLISPRGVEIQHPFLFRLDRREGCARPSQIQGCANIFGNKPRVAGLVLGSADFIGFESEGNQVGRHNGFPV